MHLHEQYTLPLTHRPNTLPHTNTHKVPRTRAPPTHTYSMRQYNVIVPFLRNETKTERPFPLYETPHPFRRNGRTVLKRSQNDSSLNKTMKNDSCPVLVRPYHVIEAIAEMFLCPLETLHFTSLANQLAIGTASERPARAARHLRTVMVWPWRKSRACN